MDDAFGDALMVEMKDFLAKRKVLKLHRAGGVTEAVADIGGLLNEPHQLFVRGRRPQVFDFKTSQRLEGSLP